MNMLFNHWLSLSVALAALAGVIVVVIALVRQRQELNATADSIAHAAVNAAAEAAAKAAIRESEKLTKPLIRAHKDLLQQFATLEQRQEELDTGFESLRKKQLQLAEQQQRLDEAHKSLQARQDEVEEQTPESRFYQRAAKLVEKGASVDELMTECEIPRNEAELLISLHRA